MSKKVFRACFFLVFCFAACFYCLRLFLAEKVYIWLSPAFKFDWCCWIGL